MKTRTVLFAAIGALVAIGLGWRWASRRRHLPCPAWLAWILDNPWTETVGGTRITLDRIGLRPGERGLDVGCGPGRLSLPAAQRVGPSGEIVALDVQPAMLARLERRMAMAGVTNITARLSDVATDSNLPSESFDRAWLVTVLGEIPDRQAALRNIHRVLKPGGTLSITELLPDPHYQSHGTVRRLAEAVGFQPAQTYGNVFAFTMNWVKPANTCLD